MAPASSLFLTLYGIAAFAVALLYFRPRRQSFVESFPPGPKSPTMPTLDSWVQYQQWGREHGDLVYIRKHNTLIINHAHVAIDLLEKHARIYSDRAMTEMMKLCGFNNILSLEQYSDKWRGNRKLFQQNFRQSASRRFYPAQYRKISQYLRDLTVAPEEFMQHTMSLSQSLIYSSLYGLDIGFDDPLSKKAIEAVALIGRAILEPFPAIELFPWLRFMPSWFPGCGFQQIANKCAQYCREVDNIPFDKAISNLASAGTSLIAELALENEGKPVEIKKIKAMGTVSFLAASDTTMASISSFLLAMIQNPDVQSKAQAEIDHVIGRDRLPTLEDRRSLPYVESVYREVMRMHPPLPLSSRYFLTFCIGHFHVSIEDDFYRGYHIPKGCKNFWPSVWSIFRAMGRDPNVYSEPDKFMPERFLDSPNGPFTSINDIHAFGFGRRVCVGRYMADNTVWLAIASVLATLDLHNAKDNEGNEIDIPGEYTEIFFRHPKPYQSSITPRDLQARDLILATGMVD
ncbi:cytochrome P450 1 [Rhodocollybia butyracea]|uniref:Cytochrome P450 1 n=1 Tax=Rhodocollybia butyracea TaxID=206335 RepID=A0A9P5PQD4_9AGAR|nr:cytochrome P450 1 [Rhodocollybia butyracea]